MTVLGKAKATLSVEQEPRPTIEEIRSKMRAMLHRTPDLMTHLTQMMNGPFLVDDG